MIRIFYLKWLDKLKRHIVFVVAVSLTLVAVYCIWDGESLVSKSSKRIASPRHREKFNNTLLWVVNVKNEAFVNTELGIDKIASELGCDNVGPVDEMDGCHLFSLKGQSHVYDINNVWNRSLASLHTLHTNMFEQRDISEIISIIEEKFDRSPHIIWYSHEKIVSRAKRWFNPVFMSFKDPMYRKQWHLTNTFTPHMDTNVTGVWKRNITGQGVTVAVVDDGLEWNNPDLKDNYNKAGSWDFNDNDNDPMPDGSKESNHHGTRCAGEISAIPNDICGVGVAYGAKVSGLRILDGPMTDSLEGSAFTKFFQVNDIYSCSWGPDDDGKTVDGPHVLASAAIKRGIDFGRHGYGSIYVVASGNGGNNGDNCNFDGYANSIYTVTIGAVDETGHMPFYSEECASMLAVTFSSGGSYTRDIVTTDWTASVHASKTGCTEHHSGTSAAAPLAAGMIALMLQVQPCLTWRDVQYLIILTAKKVDIDVAHWSRNGAGLWHSHKHGFGLMNAWRLTNAARVWNMVPWLTSFSYSQPKANLQIPRDKHKPLKVSYTVTKSETDRFALYILETVQVTVSIDHPHRGHLDIRLISPHGTASVIGATRPKDNSSTGFDKWTFATVRCWGESPYGTWVLIITDKGTSPNLPSGILKSWTLKMFGTPMTPTELRNRRNSIERAMYGGMLNKSSYCPPPPVTAKPDDTLSVKTLKTIVLAGAFIIFLAVYESLEYLCCYNEEKKEHSRTRKLLKRAHRRAYELLQSANNTSDCDNTEQTALLSEEIPMDTFQSASDLDLGAVGGVSEEILNIHASLQSVENNQNVTDDSSCNISRTGESTYHQSRPDGSTHNQSMTDDSICNQSREGTISGNRNHTAKAAVNGAANISQKTLTDKVKGHNNVPVNTQQGQIRTKGGYMLLSNMSDDEEEEDSV